MGNLIYCTELKTRQIRPVCPLCSKNLCKKRYEKGRTPFHKDCSSCADKRVTGLSVTTRWRSDKKYSYFKYKKDYCESCGFRGHSCQLDVDHIDGNHGNNAPYNLTTLCANCHRLKSYRNKEHLSLNLRRIG
jgi:hypothetical protein